MNFLDQLDEFTSQLRDAAVWHESGELLADLEIENQCDAPSDFIYELYCLFRIARDLARRYLVKFVEGIFSHRRQFPRKPAHKRGWPRFHVFDPNTNELLVQICAGTKVKSSAIGEFRAPDISFQRPDASEDPTESDVLCIHDDKFNEGRKKTDLSESEYAKVLMMVGDLKLNNAIPVALPIQFSELNGFDSNCVLTNGGPWTRNHARHIHNRLRVIYHFHKSLSDYGIVGK